MGPVDSGNGSSPFTAHSLTLDFPLLCVEHTGAPASALP
jgi:hypothetical protein